MHFDVQALVHYTESTWMGLCWLSSRLCSVSCMDCKGIDQEEQTGVSIKPESNYSAGNSSQVRSSAWTMVHCLMEPDRSVRFCLFLVFELCQSRVVRMTVLYVRRTATFTLDSQRPTRHIVSNRALASLRFSNLILNKRQLVTLTLWVISIKINAKEETPYKPPKCLVRNLGKDKS